MSFQSEAISRSVHSTHACIQGFSSMWTARVLWENDPIIAMQLITYMEFIEITSFCPRELKVRISVGLFREQAREWWEDVGRALVASAIEVLTWLDFVSRFILSLHRLLRNRSWRGSSKTCIRRLKLWRRSPPSFERGNC